MRIYFDNAATTPIDSDVLEVMIPLMREEFGNPSSIHAHGRKTRAVIENSRKSVARILNCTPGEIIFTSGGTEADNMAIIGACHDLGVKRIISSAIEHHAVGHTIEHLVKSGQVEFDQVDLYEDGSVNLEHLETLLQKPVSTLVSLMHANNEIGVLLPVKEVGEMCKKYKALFHSDTVQTMGHYRIDPTTDQIDFLTCAAHKFHGPKGVGFLYVSNKIKISPFIYGGSQERNMRGGTENLYGIAGLAKALEIATSSMEDHQKHISGIKNHFVTELRKRIPGVEFNGGSDRGPSESLYTVLNVRFPKTDNAEMLLFNLDIEGISVSGGSACTSGSNQGSHVLKGIGADMNRPSVRFSFSKYNTLAEVDFVLEKLCKLFPVAVSS